MQKIPGVGASAAPCVSLAVIAVRTNIVQMTAHVVFAQERKATVKCLNPHHHNRSLHQNNLYTDSAKSSQKNETDAAGQHVPMVIAGNMGDKNKIEKN